MKHCYKKTIACLLVMVIAISAFAVGCSKSPKSALDPENPVTVTIWNYYNGDQLAAFEQLVNEFNLSVGTEKGIVVVSASQGDISTLADSLIESVDGKAGAKEAPTLAAVYSETGYILNQKEKLASFDPYFTDEELSQYIKGFIDEGRFGANNELMLFPTSKSTEVFSANKTDWEEFAKATGVTLDSLKTEEDLVSAAQKYYEWTDSLTPNVKEDGKALYGRDSIGNYMYIGCCQLGHPMFTVENGELSVDLDKDTFKTLWDNYYIPYINGYYGSFAKFRSEDAKTGKILSLTSSSSGANYLPTEVTDENDETHPIEIYTTAALPFEDATKDVAVQQGANYCMLKSTDAQQEGAVEFLKWFTEPERNTDFSLMSGYAPVTTEANTTEALKKAYKDDTTSGKGKTVFDSLSISAETFTTKETYATKPFAGSKDVRSILDSSIQDIASADRATVEKEIKAGKTRDEATAEFSTDEYFENWFNGLSKEINDTIAANTK